MYSYYRRNADENLRRLQRSDDIQERVRLIANRVRAGQIYHLEVLTAAYLGDPAALLYTDGEVANIEDDDYSLFVSTPVTRVLRFLFNNWLYRGLSGDVVRVRLWNAAVLDFAEHVAPICAELFSDNQHMEAINAARRVLVSWNRWTRLQKPGRPANYAQLSREERRQARHRSKLLRNEHYQQKEALQIEYNDAHVALDEHFDFLEDVFNEITPVTAVGEPLRDALNAIRIAVGSLSNRGTSSHSLDGSNQAARWAANARVDFHAPEDAPERLAEIEWQSRRLCQYLLGDVDF